VTFIVQVEQASRQRRSSDSSQAADAVHPSACIVLQSDEIGGLSLRGKLARASRSSNARRR
jgi:hypothetical protein